MIRHGEFKVPGGKLVVVDFTERDGVIHDFRLSGDFFLEPDSALETINRAVTGLGTGATIAEIARKVDEAFPHDGEMLGITADSVGIAVHRARNDASRWRELDWTIVRTPPLAPVLNVALDEVLVREVASGRRGPTMRLWEWDSDAVIIGSFQSVRNEVDEREADELGTQIIRRISGGGAMYMQPASSITYSLYVPSSFVDGMSFAESYAFLDAWVVEALYFVGVEATYAPLNDITSPAGKIGGAAQKRLASGAVLHHVTMAYDMNADRMARVLRVGREKLSDKGTKSASKRVDPLRSQTGLSRDAILDHLAITFQKRHGGESGAITPAELATAEALVASKFSTAEWLRRVP